MSGTFPTSPSPKALELINDQPIISSVSRTRRSQRRITAGHLWLIKASYPSMFRAAISPLFAFSAKQRGDSFQITLIDKNTPQGAGTGTPLVQGAVVAGTSSIPIDGWTFSITGILKAGDILKFANHTKVYMVEDDVNSDGAGLANISITPPLIEALIDNEAVTINNVPFTVTFKDGVHRWKTTNPEISTYTIDLIEAVA